MGTWSSALYGNDTTCDVKDSYELILENEPDDNLAFSQLMDEFNGVLGTDEEPLFWYAAAETQWRYGILSDEVKDKAVFWITEERESPMTGNGWKKTLEKLQTKLETPSRSKRNRRKPADFIRNPWSVGDVYAYQFHTQIARERGLYGKYILFQKYAEMEWIEDHVFSVVRIYNAVFDEIPSLKVYNELPILPLVKRSIQDLRSVISEEEYKERFEELLQTPMFYYKEKDYPFHHISFVAHENIGQYRYYYTGTSLTWEKDGMDDWLTEFYLDWKDTIVDGNSRFLEKVE